MLMRGFLGALVAVVILSSAARADEADAVKLVEKLGGKITRDDKQPGKPVVEVNLSLKKVTEAGVKELKELEQLTRLILGGTQGTDAGLKELKHLEQLTELRVIGSPVTNAGLKELKDFKRLTKLDISGCKALTDAGLKELKDLK